jgi:hypothetical protein
MKGNALIFSATLYPQILRKRRFFIEVPEGKCQGRVGLIATNQSRLPGGISGGRLFFVLGDFTANPNRYLRVVYTGCISRDAKMEIVEIKGKQMIPRIL